MRQSETKGCLRAYRYGVEMTEDLPLFWMNGRLAYDLLEISSDPAALDTGGFWAVSTTFEGEWTCARFGSVIDAPLPNSEGAWQKLSSKWESSIDRDGYLNYVLEIQRHIAEGWVYQVNACRQLQTAIADDKDLLSLMQEILRSNPAPFASYLRLPDLEIASASPELFLARKGLTITSGPIKGTNVAGDINFGDKDKAENIMIVDLIRNDVGKISEPGSVHVPRLLAPELHPGLTHLVSDIQGTLRKRLSWSDIGAALLPPGSVSGAPKSSAVKVIQANEDQPRGPYCGGLGWVEGDQANLAVAIRTFWKTGDGLLRFGTGAGITWGSDAAKEWDETVLKAARLISIAGGVIA